MKWLTVQKVSPKIQVRDFMELKLKMQLRIELSRSAMLRLTMNELVTVHMRR